MRTKRTRRPPLDQSWRADRARRADRLGARRLDRWKGSENEQADPGRRATRRPFRWRCGHGGWRRPDADHRARRAVATRSNRSRSRMQGRIADRGRQRRQALPPAMSSRPQGPRKGAEGQTSRAGADRRALRRGGRRPARRRRPTSLATDGKAAACSAAARSRLSRAGIAAQSRGQPTISSGLKK